METQTRLSRHNKFISAENIIAILSVSSDDSLHKSHNFDFCVSLLLSDMDLTVSVDYRGSVLLKK